MAWCAELVDLNSLAQTHCEDLNNKYSAGACIALTVAFRRRSLTVAMTGRWLGHGNGFAKLHAHDGVVGARKGAATTVVTVGGARCSWRGTRTRYARQIR